MITANVTGQVMECFQRPGKDLQGNSTVESVSVLYVNGGSAITINNCNLLEKGYEIGDQADVKVDIYNGKKDLFVRKSRT